MITAAHGGRPTGIRPVAIAVILRDDGALLVTSAVDSATGRTYVRPPGGGIEPGEYAAETIVRELREELGVTAQDPRLFRVVENQFTVAGRDLHEHVFLFNVAFSADWNLPPTTDAGRPVWWLTRDRWDDASIDLVPAGLATMLRDDESSTPSAS